MASATASPPSAGSAFAHAARPATGRTHAPRPHVLRRQDRSAARRATGAAMAWLRANGRNPRSEEHTSELQSLMRISYAVFCLKKKNTNRTKQVSLYRLDYYRS